MSAVALRNSHAILVARQREEQQLIDAKEALEVRTRELGYSLALMRATLESTADGILVTQVDGGVVMFNERFLQIWGLTREKVEGATHANLLPWVAQRFADPAAFGSRLRDIYAVPTAEVLDILELSDGRVLERFSRPQQVDTGFIGRVWSFRDITDRRRVENAVREEARLLDLLNRTGSAIAATLDLQTLLQRVTDAATQLSGAEFGAFLYDTGDTAGQPADMHYTLSGATCEAFERFGPPRATPLFAPTFRGEAPIRCDDVLLDPRYGQWAPHRGTPDGHLAVRSYLAVAVTSRTGASIGGLFFGHSKVGVFTDRTERLLLGIATQASVAIDNARLYEETKRVAVEREQLVQAERAARQEITRVSHLKDEFLATLSHELRTPLGAIVGWADVLRRKMDDPVTQRRGLDTIARNAAAQTRLINDLLDMNSIISGKLRLEVQPTDLAKVLDAAIEAVRPAAEAKNIRLQTIVDSVAGPVYGDANRLQQVAWNLLTNAVKYTPKDGAVKIILQRANSHLEFIVSDNGIGISAEFMPYLFDRFRQADASTTRRHGGLGLGLSIVKQLVELHGGTVRANSDGEGSGATFTVCLPLTPLRAPPEVDAVGAPGPAELPSMDADLSGVKVLVVDDEADARELIKQVLQDCRAQVRTAASAAEALAVLKGFRPHLLLSDIGMPSKDGYELIREVRSLAQAMGGRTPAIALTAFARSEDRTRAMRAGYQVHMSKPIEPHELVATVASLVGRMGTHGDR